MGEGSEQMVEKEQPRVTQWFAVRLHLQDTAVHDLMFFFSQWSRGSGRGGAADWQQSRLAAEQIGSRTD